MLQSAQPRNLFKGALWTTVSQLVLALLALLIKWGSHAFSTEMLLVVRFFFGTCVLLLIQALRHDLKRLGTRRLGAQFLLAAIWAGALFSFYISLRWVNLMDATLFVCAGSLYTPVFAWLLFKEKEQTTVWLGVAIGLAGVAVILHPGHLNLGWIVLLPMLSGILGCLRGIVNSRLVRTENDTAVTFYSVFFSLLLCAPLLAFSGIDAPDWQQHLFPPRDWAEPMIIYPYVAIAVLALGLLGILQPYFRSLGLRHASASQAAPFLYMCVVFSALLDWFFYGVRPPVASIIGFALVLAGGLVVIMGKRHNA